jgi:hypothetical protein
MDAATIKLRTYQLKQHIDALKEWRLQEAVALASALREQRHALYELQRVESAISGAEIELEFLKGVS